MDTRIYRDFTPAEYAGYEKYNGVMTFANGDPTNGLVQFDEGCMWFGAIDKNLQHYETRDVPTIHLFLADSRATIAKDTEGHKWFSFDYTRIQRLIGFKPCRCSLCNNETLAGWWNDDGDVFCGHHVSTEG